MGKLEQEVHINWAQLITTIAVSIIVSAGGATIALMTSQASTDQRLVALEQRASSIERNNERTADSVIELRGDVSQVRESLARIEGALGIKKR
jgi:hypothetical protein